MSSTLSTDYGSTRRDQTFQGDESSSPPGISPPLLPADPHNETSPLLPSARQSPQEESQERRGSKPLLRLCYPRFIYTICSLLLFIIISLLLLLSLVPRAAQEYAQGAVLLQVNSIAIDSFTDSGAKARLQGQVTVDASKVKRVPVRTMGTLTATVLKFVHVKASSVEIFLPDYSMGRLGSATYPDVVIDMRDGKSTPINIISEIEHGSLDVVKSLLDDFVNGKIDYIRLNGKSAVSAKAGIFYLGTHELSHMVSFDKIPSLPSFNITRLVLDDVGIPGKNGIEANMSVAVTNDYPLELRLPPIALDISLPACHRGLIQFATAQTSEIYIKPFSPITADVTGQVDSIPDALTRLCPDTETSPIDNFLAAYIRGLESKIYVKITAANSKATEIPDWIVDFLKEVSIPLPVPAGQSFDNLIKSFTLTDVDFSLPSPTAPSGSPDSFPRLSANVVALVTLPEEINFPVKVSSIKADANLLYNGGKFGELHTNRFVPATTSTSKDGLEISAAFSDVPLNVTDIDLFSEVVQKIIFGKGDGVILDIEGTADAMIDPAQLGSLVVRGIPAQGHIFVKKGGSLEEINPHVSNLSIISTSRSSFTFMSNISFDNPTEYSAYVPYFNLHVLSDGVLLGNVTARNSRLNIGTSWAVAETVWSPANVQINGSDAGSRFLGDYVSGKNTTITLKIHERSIPSLPILCKALENLEINLSAPPLSSPGDDDNDGGQPDDPDHPATRPHIIRSATLHVLSSTGSFVLNNPLLNTSIYISRITGWATHNGTILGTINYTYPIKVPPGISETPKLPVEWSLGGMGYEIVRKALGGILKVDANAECDVQLESYECRLDIESTGIGAHVAL